MAGLGTLGVGLWLRFDPAVADYMRINEKLENFYTAVYVLMLVGAIMSVMGFLGCCGAWRENRCMLATVADFLIFPKGNVLYCVTYEVVSSHKTEFIPLGQSMYFFPDTPNRKLKSNNTVADISVCTVVETAFF